MHSKNIMMVCYLFVLQTVLCKIVDVLSLKREGAPFCIS